MPTSNDLRGRLREETRQDHLQVDQILSTLGLAYPLHYIRFLHIHVDALSELAGCTLLADREHMAVLLGCLQQDLNHYDQARIITAAAAVETPIARQVGVSYVVRGSRLGAHVLRQRVAPDSPSGYLAYRPMRSWSSVVQDLAQFSLAHSGKHDQEVVAGAKFAFGVFLRVAQSSAQQTQ